MTRFLRTQAVAVLATAIDFCTTALLLCVLPVAPAVAFGAVAGAATACTLNHIWSFGGNGNRPSRVALRYALVWIGSLGLNTYGTVLLAAFLQPVLLAKAVVAVAVGCTWNFLLMRHYVYRQRGTAIQKTHIYNKE